VENYPLELFRVWLLLGEALPASQFEIDGLDFRWRPAYSSAVAARHWFSTACQTIQEQTPQDPLLPVGLPGRYITRGDWFLACAKGSRSPRLGAWAQDLLSSRRANFTRMQAGLGLPTRDILQREQKADYRTPLSVYTDTGERQEPVYYEQLRALGAGGLGTEIDPYPEGRQEMRWLWRSAMPDYDRHSRIWHKWLCRMIFNWGDWIRKDVGREIECDG